MISLQRRCKKHRQNQVFSIRGLTFKKYTPKSYFTELRGGYLCSLEFYRTAILEKYIMDGSLLYNPTTAGQTSRLPCRLLIEITTLIYKRYEISVLQFADDTNLAALKELHDSVDFLAFRHLLLNLVDSIEHAGLTMEHKTIGIGNMADDFF